MSSSCLKRAALLRQLRLSIKGVPDEYSPGSRMEWVTSDIAVTTTRSQTSRWPRMPAPPPTRQWRPMLALPATDTLKKAKQGQVASTVDRAFIWRAQTPQLFRLDLLINALTESAERGLGVTDEASAMERAGYAPRLVRGRESNIKVTYPEDLPLAEFWLARQEQHP